MSNYFAIREESIDVFQDGEETTILHLSDLHFTEENGRAQQILKSAQELQPDVICLTGDYADSETGIEMFKELMDELAKISVCYYVLGNHDDWLIESNGTWNSCPSNIHFVGTSSQTYQSGTRSIRFGGAGIAHHQNFKLSVRLDHYPSQFQSISKQPTLTLSGHLHGGQFVFWKQKSTTHFPANLIYKNVVDRKDIGKDTLIVSRGLGDSFPLRFNCPYEMVFIKVR